jgi:large subunit ribosomal protein L14e
MEFTMRSFFYTVEHRVNIKKSEKVPNTSYTNGQSEVMTSRFFTWPFFLAYVQKAHDTLLKLRGEGWAETSVKFPDATYFDKLWPFKFTKVTYLGFASRFLIPEKLLHGPWTDDKASLLYVLVSFGGQILWHETVAGETAKEGLKEAVEAGNERAVAALSVLLGIERAITTEDLRHVVVTCGCDLSLLRHVLFSAQISYSMFASIRPGPSRPDIDFHDPVLWQWADEEEAAKTGKGEILKDMLKRAEEFDLQFYFDGETDWDKIVPFPYSGSRFDARATFNDASREFLAKLFINHGQRITNPRARLPEYVPPVPPGDQD